MGKSAYQSIYSNSLSAKEEFWQAQAGQLDWFKQPTSILQNPKQNRFEWFVDGEMNTCHLALDYHVQNGRADQVALIYDSPVTNTKKTYTYAKLLDQVARFAGGLKSLGIEKGDTVVIYMPMIPEAAIAMLACARIGAIHSVVFGGFAPHELAIRIDDAKPKAIITASCGIEINKIIPYKPYVDEALKESTHQPEYKIIHERPEQPEKLDYKQELGFYHVMSQGEAVKPEPLKSPDPLYVLYTSGTTGRPKGIVRDNGGHATALKFSMNTVYNAKPGEIYWAASDVGWVVGHSYIVYAPLVQGCTTILFEGKPIKTPDAGTFWRIIEEYKVNHLFTAPTAFRAIKKEDFEGEFIKQYDISSLKTLFLAGERCDPTTYQWASDHLKIPVVDHWWQTETGWPIVANPMGIKEFPVKAGSATFPVPGFDVRILDEGGQEVEAGKEGYIAVKLPLPPGCMKTLWNDEERFVSSYLSTFDGHYTTGDGGFKDEDGYVYIMGRIDDVINVSGHRLSTGEMEEIVATHEHVAECAVIGIPDELKGEIPLGIFVAKNDSEFDHEELEQELISLVRNQIGAVACFKKLVEVQRLPKTRSGKILRKTMRQIISGESYAMPSTIDDPVILDEITTAFKEHKLIAQLETEKV
ncbi:MAG: propionyl-CoA synthetase [Bacteroidota bacterium]